MTQKESSITILPQFVVLLIGIFAVWTKVKVTFCVFRFPEPFWGAG